MLPFLTKLDCYFYSEVLLRMTQCCMGQDCLSVLLYMMHSNNNENNDNNNNYSHISTLIRLSERALAPVNAEATPPLTHVTNPLIMNRNDLCQIWHHIACDCSNSVVHCAICNRDKKS